MAFVYNYNLDFDGVDQSVQIANVVGERLSTADFSIEFSLKFDTNIAADSTIIDLENELGSTGIRIYIKGTGSGSGIGSMEIFAGQFADTTPITTDDAILTGRWYHYVLSADRDGNMVLYQNAVALKTVDISGDAAVDLASTVDWRIGDRLRSDIPQEAGFVTGQMRNVGIYNSKALSQDDVTLRYKNGNINDFTGSESGLSWASNFSDGTGSTLTAITGTDGTITGSAAWQVYNTFIEQAILYLLDTDIVVNSVVGDKLYPNLIAQGQAVPYLTYEQTAGTRDQTLASPTGFVDSSFSIRCFSNSYSEVRTLADAVRRLLDGYSATVTSVTIQAIHLVNEEDIGVFPAGKDVIKRYAKRLDFTVWYDELFG